MKWLSGPNLRVTAVGLSLALGVGMAPMAVANEDAQRVMQTEHNVADLTQRVEVLRETMSAFMPPRRVPEGIAADVAQPVIEVAQSSREAASLNVRLSEIEEQMRLLNGQVEGLQFQMTQMQTFLERLQEDYEFRFQELEGTSSGKTSAAPQSGGAMLSGGAPQTQSLTVPPTGALDLNAPDGPAGGLDGAVTLGAPERPLGTLESNAVNLGDRSLDFSAVDTGIVNDGDADAQYRAGYEAVVRGDYEFAEDQFRQFVELFPKHRQAPEAVNWLGEALIQRGAYDDAAEVFFEGFEAYSNSTRAPDLLMKLGIALHGAGEDDTACRTFSEVHKRFPDQPASFMSRLADEMRAARC